MTNKKLSLAGKRTLGSIITQHINQRLRENARERFNTPVVELVYGDLIDAYQKAQQAAIDSEQPIIIVKQKVHSCTLSPDDDCHVCDGKGYVDEGYCSCCFRECDCLDEEGKNE